MFSRLAIFDKRYNELEKRMYEPDVVSDPDRYREVMREYASIEPVVKKYRDEAAKISNLVIGGRLGQYKYFDMDKSIQAALKLKLEV